MRNYRLITLDLRAHGLSDKPADPEADWDGKAWGEDQDSVIKATVERAKTGLSAGAPGPWLQG